MPAQLATVACSILFAIILYSSLALARPFRGGPVTLNGAPLYREAALKPGDLLGLGSHFLFLYRDPRVTPAPPLALPPPWQGDMSTSYGPGWITDRQEMLRQYLGSTESLLRFQAKHADALLQVNTDTIEYSFWYICHKQTLVHVNTEFWQGVYHNDLLQQTNCRLQWFKIRQQLRQHFSVNVYNMAYLVSAAMKLHLGKILPLVNCGV